MNSVYATAQDWRQVDDGGPSELFARFAAHRDPALRARLVLQHRWIAVQAARRFEHRGEPFDDLLQVAMVGLMKAVERFQPELGNAFVSFASPTVIGEIKRHFRDTTWSAHVPRRAKELQARVRRTARRLESQCGHSPRVSEVAEATGLDEDLVIEMAVAANAYRAVPLAAPTDDDPGTEPVAQDVGLGAVIDQTAVGQVLATLGPRDRHIIEQRFFQNRTQAEIADDLGISQVHVGRLLASTLARLRWLLTDAGC